ncbi:MAG: hypothetical protein ACI85Q_000117 [Salibacteraceae bacterium]|jgi:hypothetical protein
MKKTILLSAVVAFLGLTTSCEKCATCTFNDPVKGTLTNEVCTNGHAYDNAIEVHEDNGWSCAN